MEVAVFYNLILGVTFVVFHLLDFEATSPATFIWKELHKDTNTTKRDLWKPFQKMSSIYQEIFRIYQGLFSLVRISCSLGFVHLLLVFKRMFWLPGKRTKGLHPGEQQSLRKTQSCSQNHIMTQGKEIPRKVDVPSFPTHLQVRKPKDLIGLSQHIKSA